MASQGRVPDISVSSTRKEIKLVDTQYPTLSFFFIIIIIIVVVVDS